MGLVTRFLERYKKYMWIQEAFVLQPITEEDVWENFQAITQSAGGMDGWEPMEFKYFSKVVCGWVAVVLQLVEGGAAWPSSTRHAKIAYLEKEGSVPGEVMSYRPLTIMSPLYRGWASLRLRALEGWIRGWALPEMYAGVPNQGATDAAYSVLLEVELLTMKGIPFCGGAADILQILRSSR